ncbi:hypothetical protein DIPPA_09907 [Diplonema papillatum]|nr:hypothetical protein DIPPA_09907 [Diplonema papillatum]
MPAPWEANVRLLRDLHKTSAGGMRVARERMPCRGAAAWDEGERVAPPVARAGRERAMVGGGGGGGEARRGGAAASFDDAWRMREEERARLVSRKAELVAARDKARDTRSLGHAADDQPLPPSRSSSVDSDRSTTADIPDAPSSRATKPEVRPFQAAAGTQPPAATWQPRLPPAGPRTLSPEPSPHGRTSPALPPPPPPPQPPAGGVHLLGMRSPAPPDVPAPGSLLAPAAPARVSFGYAPPVVPVATAAAASRVYSPARKPACGGAVFPHASSTASLPLSAAAPLLQQPQAHPRLLFAPLADVRAAAPSPFSSHAAPHHPPLPLAGYPPPPPPAEAAPWGFDVPRCQQRAPDACCAAFGGLPAAGLPRCAAGGSACGRACGGCPRRQARGCCCARIPHGCAARRRRTASDPPPCATACCGACGGESDASDDSGCERAPDPSLHQTTRNKQPRHSQRRPSTHGHHSGPRKACCCVAPSRAGSDASSDAAATPKRNPRTPPPSSHGHHAGIRRACGCGVGGCAVAKPGACSGRPREAEERARCDASEIERRRRLIEEQALAAGAQKRLLDEGYRHLAERDAAWARYRHSGHQPAAAGAAGPAESPGGVGDGAREAVLSEQSAEIERQKRVIAQQRVQLEALGRLLLTSAAEPAALHPSPLASSAGDPNPRASPPAPLPSRVYSATQADWHRADSLPLNTSCASVDGVLPVVIAKGSLSSRSPRSPAESEACEVVVVGSAPPDAAPPPPRTAASSHGTNEVPSRSSAASSGLHFQLGSDGTQTYTAYRPRDRR